MRQRLVKAPEIRKLLDLDSAARVYDLARQGILPGVVRLGRQIRFDLDKVLEFVATGGQALSGGWRRAAAPSTSHTTAHPASPHVGHGSGNETHQIVRQSE